MAWMFPGFVSRQGSRNYLLQERLSFKLWALQPSASIQVLTLIRVSTSVSMCCKQNVAHRRLVIQRSPVQKRCTVKALKTQSCSAGLLSLSPGRGGWRSTWDCTCLSGSSWELCAPPHCQENTNSSGCPSMDWLWESFMKKFTAWML